MIHTVKATNFEGRGSSKREIAARLKTSRNTVRSCMEMSVEAIAAYREGQRRRRQVPGLDGLLR